MPGPGDAAWTDEDRDLALDWQYEQDQRCHGCGHPVDESMDPALAGSWDVERVLCYACEVRERVADKARRAADPPYGVKFLPVLDRLDDE